MSSQKTKLKVKECRGCSSRNYCNLKPYYIDDQNNKLECPCVTCLVKGICRNLCNDLRVYSSHFWAYYKIYYENII